MTRLLATTITAATLLAGAASMASADSAGAGFSTGHGFTQQTGADIYAGLCQACHMADGKGATGAGTYPSLAGNEGLEAASYPIYVVLHGKNGMPPFGGMLSDEQVAAVVAYVRTNFGNDYKEPVTAAEVKEAR